MKKIKTLIIEDVEDNIEGLKRILNQNCPNINVIGAAKSVDEAYDFICNNTVELVLSDVQIIDGTSFDVIDRLFKNNIINKNRFFELVFMTKYSENDYSARAFTYSAIDFFHKPFSVQEVVEAIDKATNQIELKEYKSNFESMLEIFQKENAISDFIMIHLPNRKYKKIHIDQILYLEANAEVTIFHLINSPKITAIRNLKVYREILEKNHNFFSIKNNLCVNLDHRINYNHSTNEMTMRGDIVLKGSRDFCKKYYAFEKEGGEHKRKSEQSFLEWLKIFLGRKNNQ